PHLMLRWGEDLYVLGPPSLTAPIGDVAGARAGVSRPFPPGASTRVARREAEWAATRAAESGQPLVVYGKDPTGRWLPDDTDTLAALVEHVLGPVIAYDTAHESRLLATVRAWMEHDRRSEDTAAHLHIHPNTLAYRLRRFASLTGRDLGSTAAFAEVWLALQAARQLCLLDQAYCTRSGTGSGELHRGDLPGSERQAEGAAGDLQLLARAAAQVRPAGPGEVTPDDGLRAVVRQGHHPQLLPVVPGPQRGHDHAVALDREPRRGF